MIKPRIPSANKAPLLCNDHHEKVKNFKKPRPQWKIEKWLCKICSVCENMTICVKNNFVWIFVWNMLNVWKFDHLCENLTFIGYLCEIYSMCENMVICVKKLTSIGYLCDICSMCEIWPFVWKFNFYWIFVWNMLIMWKYG
jgi:hypothetical protein